MLVLKPIVHETIWGGRRVCRMSGCEGSRVGHLYSVFCREGISNEILNGKYRGRKLNDVFPLFRDGVGMAACPFFPLTLALTEADDDLSIQVHPNDEAADAMEYMARGKRESWYLIS